MEYGIGKVGRVVVARGFDGENLYEQIESIAAKEGIASATVLLVGGLRSAKVVVGPKDPDGLIEPVFAEFDDAREIVGVGTIFSDDGGPKLHLHTAIGRGKESLVGCPRGGANIFAVMEMVMTEITGAGASRELDPTLGIKLLTLGAGGAAKSSV